MRSDSWVLLVRTLLCSLLFISLIGCEDDDADIPESNSYESADRGNLSGPVPEEATVVAVEDLTVSPSEVTLDDDTDMASFTASGGVAPYSWSVQDVFRGSIVDSGGAGAVYQRSAAGDNSVVVEDSRGEKAYAVIMQP